jgi:hypothetical protein
MKRCIRGIALVTTCVTVLLIGSTVAMARESALTRGARASSGAALRDRSFPSSPHSAVPAGTGIIRGTVLDYAGQPVPSADLMWLIGDWEASGGAQTEAKGSYEMSGVPAASGIGEIWMQSSRDQQAHQPGSRCSCVIRGALGRTRGRSGLHRAARGGRGGPASRFDSS